MGEGRVQSGKFDATPVLDTFRPKTIPSQTNLHNYYSFFFGVVGCGPAAINIRNIPVIARAATIVAVPNSFFYFIL